tara:strand:- start:274 stop:1047 length:774 start_codon:yes stop_codon:yes gene_type:complete
MTAAIEVHQFLCLDDNYGYLVHAEPSGLTAAIDAPEAKPILAALASKGWTLDLILNTHHHADHAGGNLELKERTGCSIVGSRADAARIPGIDREVGEGDSVTLGDHRFEVHDTPGHTSGHIVYHAPGDGIAFVGDTLFALGCGRLFEGTPAQMWQSLQKILRWPGQTRIYCAHEYTQANARFAITVEPGNPDLAQRCATIDTARSRGEPTVPSTLDLEKRTNPFLRPHSPNLQQTVGLTGASEVAVFARIRELKDSF